MLQSIQAEGGQCWDSQVDPGTKTGDKLVAVIYTLEQELRVG